MTTTDDSDDRFRRLLGELEQARVAIAEAHRRLAEAEAQAHKSIAAAEQGLERIKRAARLAEANLKREAGIVGAQAAMQYAGTGLRIEALTVRRTPKARKVWELALQRVLRVLR